MGSVMLNPAVKGSCAKRPRSPLTSTLGFTTHTTSNPPMSSLCIALVAAIVLSGCASMHPTKGPPEPGLAGAWLADVTLLDCASNAATGAPPIRALVVFHVGGTLTEASGPSVRRTPSFGTWVPTGNAQYIAVSTLLTYEANGNPSGSQEIRRTIRLSSDGKRFVAETQTVATDTSGTVAFRGCARGEAKRLE